MVSRLLSWDRAASWRRSLYTTGHTNGFAMQNSKKGSNDEAAKKVATEKANNAVKILIDGK